jgi:hypothetical protein
LPASIVPWHCQKQYNHRAQPRFGIAALGLTYAGAAVMKRTAGGRHRPPDQHHSNKSPFQMNYF